MTLTVESTNSEFATIRTGRASSALLDRVMVDYNQSLAAVPFHRS